MKLTNAIRIIFFFLVGVFCHAQELPPVDTYTPQNYNGEAQNWSINQSLQGYIYVANNKGLLEFNGANWKLYPTPNETIMRSVKVVDDRVYTGCHMDFGYWKRNPKGILHYTSLTQKNAISLLEDEQFWNILTLDGWVLFQSLERIYLYHPEKDIVKIVNAEASITKMFKVDDTIYFQKSGLGLYKIEKGIAKLVSNAQILTSNRIVLLTKINAKLIALTENQGFFELDNTNGNAIREKYPRIKELLSSKTIYSALQLQNGDFIIGTIAHGALYITKTGDLLYRLNQKNALSNNTILSVFEDKTQNIWLGLDRGINTINISASFNIYKDIDGNLGTVYTAALYNGNLYLGTNQGLFYKKYNTKDKFRFIEKTEGQVWSLTTIEGTLFCGHHTGTYRIENDKAISISSVLGTWKISRISENTLLQGNYNGLHILKKENGAWKYAHKIKGFDNSSRYFELYHNNLIFVNHEYKGVFKLQANTELTEIVNNTTDTTTAKGIHSSLLKYQGNILYAYRNGVYRYLDKAKKFEKDTFLTKLIPKKEFTSGKLVRDHFNTRIFGFSKNNINYLTPGKLSANSMIKSIPISESFRKAATGFENIQRIDDKNYLVGILNGYLLIDIDEKRDLEEQITIHSITKHTLNTPEEHLQLKPKGSIVLAPKENNLTFKYNIPYLTKDLKVSYQYMLEGELDEWSNWSNNPEILFKNLSFGEYTFKVRGKVGNIMTKNIASYTFSIARPWYLSNTAIVCYVLVVLLFSLFMDTVYKRYYRRQRERLLKEQEKEFELKTLANDKELMRVKNEQLRMDVEGKSRELATSTMSIIKKNELLGVIKKTLNSGEPNNVKKVVKIIDQNLNNTDDWQMFKEAFNNADKDFIKKVKELHPALTPNDLRLCAYLRLNLSSKEIAPLLNISPRSVEVKRYRLRKKMELPHDENLTSYILEI